MEDKKEKANSERICPIPNTHNRLDQVHLLWHQALEKYDSPDGFVANLNSTIEALRNVTFMLQNEKHEIPDFDKWYDEWRNKMKTDSIMTWLSQARTIVVHSSDLETQSTARATIHTNLPLAHFSLELHPLLPFYAACEVIAQKIPEPFASNKTDLVLSIERRWVAKQLPGWELLDALGHAYGVLANIVKEAHERTGFRFETHSYHGGYCTDTTDRRLPCMVTTVESRTARISLSDGKFMVLHREPIPPLRPEYIKKVVKRYGLNKLRAPLRVEADPFLVAESLMPIAKQMLEKDKNHVRIVFLRTPNEWTIRQINASNRQEKYASMRALANEIHRLHVDALIEIAEVWMAPGEDKDMEKYPSSSESYGREEALTVTVAVSDGNFREYVTPFSRNIFGKIRFQPTKVAPITPIFLTPIFDVWGVKMPTQGNVNAS